MNRQVTKDTAATAARAAVEAYGPSTRVVLRIIFVVLAVLALLWVIAKITGIILLLVLSIFFAYLVSPLVEFLRRPRTIGKREIAIPKAAAIALSYLLILAAMVFAVLVVLPSLSNQFPEFVDQAKSYWSSLAIKTQQLMEYSRLRRLPGPVVNEVNKAVPLIVEKIGTTVTEFATAAVGYVVYIPWLVLIPILGFFLLKDAESFRRSALLMLPRGRWRWRGDEFFQDINSTLAAYIRAQLTACLFIGVVCALGFTLL
ncbi:MAG TPA: AI-2E family transporter, partial [Pyrinomonadaceae bacterium]|nr:AI-2E family transporter [Pyrinomonadaceae bacterium]